MLLGALAVDGAQANGRTLWNLGEPAPSFLNQAVTALASQIANPQEARVMGGIVDAGVHIGVGVYSATKIPLLLKETPGLNAVAPANAEVAAGEASAVARLRPVVAAGETAAAEDAVAASARPLINGIEVPVLSVSTDSNAMAREAGMVFFQKTQGWSATDKAAFWQALAEQIEAVHAPAWVSVPMRGTNGEFVFSGGSFGVHGLVIFGDGSIGVIGRTVDVAMDLSTQLVTVTKRLPQ